MQFLHQVGFHSSCRDIYIYIYKIDKLNLCIDEELVVVSFVNCKIKPFFECRHLLFIRLVYNSLAFANVICNIKMRTTVQWVCKAGFFV